MLIVTQVGGGVLCLVFVCTSSVYIELAGGHFGSINAGCVVTLHCRVLVSYSMRTYTLTHSLAYISISVSTNVQCECTDTGIWSCLSRCTSGLCDEVEPPVPPIGCPATSPLAPGGSELCGMDGLQCNYGTIDCCGEVLPEAMVREKKQNHGLDQMHDAKLDVNASPSLPLSFSRCVCVRLPVLFLVCAFTHSFCRVVMMIMSFFSPFVSSHSVPVIVVGSFVP